MSGTPRYVVGEPHESLEWLAAPILGQSQRRKLAPDLALILFVRRAVPYGIVFLIGLALGLVR